jgi:predicted nucleic acid-binding protein
VKINEALDGIDSLYIDTAPIIYFAEQIAPFAERVYAIFSRIVEGEIAGVTSTITLTEVLTKPLRDKDSEVEAAYRNMLVNDGGYVRVPVTDAVAERAALLRAQYNLRTPDALHLATAIISSCGAFLTNDYALKRVTEITILVLDELEIDLPAPADDSG